MKGRSLYQPLTAFFFIAAFLAQTFSRTLVIADYYSNQAKYAVKCENKARPQMHCNGKCQMMKKLREQEKKDQENNERKTENKIEVTLSSKSFFASVSSQQTDPAPSQVFFNRSNEHTIDRSFDIFHPPQA